MESSVLFVMIRIEGNDKKEKNTNHNAKLCCLAMKDQNDQLWELKRSYEIFRKNRTY